ncbi:hypothetical protein [Massilia sp. IC2-476]|uniref:hypothetical protein n=1 Tax=Massilia sp. IC2-476 TaxID=2887199 RepID=UPI001D0F6B9F|nr:hypothetical protein [Massilia sp. IC2-476]MCC2971384.1 hypothetical protein [Massilia sp. IC2-476]
MKSFFRLPLVLGAILSASAGAAEVKGLSMQVHDLATPFAQVWDRNAGKPDSAFVQDFKTTIASRFPAFYDVQRFGGRRTEAQHDGEIAKARTEFPSMRAAYDRKVARFTQDLPGHIASFRATFPDYAAKTDIWFLHSLGEMDGGTRTFDGKTYFIFGADAMVKYHGDGDEAAFFHHELFHDYHNMNCAKEPVWVGLWNEGLATYVAKRMNPSANNSELLLDIPHNLVADTRKQLGRAFNDLHGKLESEDQTHYAGLFQGRGGDGTGLPARRGYYLGYLVAEEIGKGMSMQQMARLECGAAHKAVVGAVEALRSQHASTGK